MTELKLMAGLHMLAAGIFVGSNVLLERVIKRLDAVPPREAARLGELLGTDIVYINFIALITAGAVGIYRLASTGMIAAFAQAEFYTTGYGVAISLMILLWVTLIISSSVITFYLRPRLLVKLPFDTSRDALEQFGNSAMAANVWMTWLGRYNLTAGVLAFLIGGFLRLGGF